MEEIGSLGSKDREREATFSPRWTDSQSRWEGGGLRGNVIPIAVSAARGGATTTCMPTTINNNGSEVVPLMPEELMW